MNIAYPAKFDRQSDGGYTVTFIDLPGAISEGDTLEEAYLNAQEALSGVLETMLDMGHPIPAPSAARGKTVKKIPPETQTQAAVLVHLARESGNRTTADLARAMETSWAAVQRLEDPRHWPSLKQLDRAARVLGKRLILSFE